MAYQRAYIPMKVISISQGYGESSSTHKLSYALDFSGVDEGRDDIYAPFDCKITKLYQPGDTEKHANTVWLTSTKKVLSPNGYYGYLTISITHPDEISGMKLGQEFKQGEVVCKEGRTGSATGNHMHLEVSKGTTANWSLEKNGNYAEYVITNPVKIEEYLFLREDAIVRNNTYKGTKYNFIKESEITYKVKNVPSEPLLVHEKNDYDKASVLKEGFLYNGDDVIKFYDIGSMSYIYHYEMMGYVAKKYLSK